MKNFTHIDFSEPSETAIDLQQMGYSQLTAVEMRKALSGQGFVGNYLCGFKFIVAIHTDGTLEGRNNVGSYDSGQWIIDSEENTFKLFWSGGWYDTTTHLYKIDNEIRTHDVTTGAWGSTLKRVIGYDTAKSYIDKIVTFDQYEDILLQAKKLNI